MARVRETSMKGRLRFEAGPLDAFKRGFKLCGTQVPSIDRRVGADLDCDLFVPTAGRDSLDSEDNDSCSDRWWRCWRRWPSTWCWNRRTESPSTLRIFRYISRRGLIEKMTNVAVRLADGTEVTLGTVSGAGRDDWRRLGVFRDGEKTGVEPGHAGARPHRGAVVFGPVSSCRPSGAIWSSTVGGKAFDGVVDCAEVYDEFDDVRAGFSLRDRAEHFSGLTRSSDFELVAGRLTEDIPSFREGEGASHGAVEVIVDVRHAGGCEAGAAWA